MTKLYVRFVRGLQSLCKVEAGIPGGQHGGQF